MGSGKCRRDRNRSRPHRRGPYPGELGSTTGETKSGERHSAEVPPAGRGEVMRVLACVSVAAAALVLAGCGSSPEENDVPEVSLTAAPEISSWSDRKSTRL